jgi:VCBS repeat-containing protein
VQGRDGVSRLEFKARNAPDFWYLDDVEVVGVERSGSGIQSASGTLEFADVDTTDEHHIRSVESAGAAYLGEFSAFVEQDSSYGGQGILSWSFEVPNEDLQFLSEGETLSQTYHVSLADRLGSDAMQSVTILLHGANDAPFAEEDEGFVREDAGSIVLGNVLTNDGDIDAADILSVLDPGSYRGAYGTLAVEADGSYAYAVDSLAANHLAHGASVEEHFA